MYLPILVALTAAIALHLIDLVRPWRTPLVSAMNILVNLVNVIIVTLVVRAGRYVDVSGAPEYADTIATANYRFNQGIRISFMIIGAIMIAEICYELWRLLQARRQVAV